MTANKLKIAQIIRILAIAVLGVLSLGMIVYSASFVRYKLDGKSVSETKITELSLTHSVEKSGDGTLTNPYADDESAIPTADKISTVQKPIILASVSYDIPLQEMAAKKPAPKKPSPKKPAPKKPVPKPKKPKAKACPT